MRKAAHLMVASLAGSLALVTCKDPLRVSLTNSLRSILQVGTPAVASSWPGAGEWGAPAADRSRHHHRACTHL